MPHERQAFTRTDRLLRRAEFLRVYEQGRRVGTREFLLYYRPGDTDHHRLGLAVPRRAGDAVRRNRARRRLREIFRLHRRSLGEMALDIVLNVSREGAEAPQPQLLESFLRAADAARSGRGRPPRKRS